MGIFIGIDGGGTKTEFAVADSQGKVLTRSITVSLSYRQNVIENIVDRLHEEILACLHKVSAEMTTVEAICMGYPCFGESPEQDSALLSALKNEFHGIDFKVVNDVEIAHMGSLGGRPGIHVVSGTGSIAFGKNTCCNTRRCGGWLDFFSDEGSCYWLGRKTMQLFSMQADGRLPKSALYEIIKDKFRLKYDFDFIDIMAKFYIPHRDKVASMQLLLSQAAKEGDTFAAALYQEACIKLKELVCTLADSLEMPSDFAVSYSGGLFKENELVLDQFISEISAIGGIVSSPLTDPCEGAIIMAMQDRKGDVEI